METIARAMLDPMDQMGTNHVPSVQREHTKIRMVHLFAKIAQKTQHRPSVLNTLQTASVYLDFITPMPPATYSASPALPTTYLCEVAMVF